MHDSIASQAVPSLFYFQNWHLAFQAVDYLDADNLPGPFQHYWSLSVEEQYYILWPILFSLILFLGHRLRGFPPLDLAKYFVSGITIASLAYSVYITEKDPAFAYFDAFARFWELGIGSLLATYQGWNEFNERSKRICSVLGITLITASFIWIDSSVSFPSYTALLPTLGSALVIIGASSVGQSFTNRVLRLSPMQLLGDVSYSLYLWHWPVLLLVTGLSSGVVGYSHGLMILAASFALAFTTKILIEDTFRFSAKRPPSAMKTATIFIAAAGIPATLSLAITFGYLSFGDKHFDVGVNVTPLSKDLNKPRFSLQNALQSVKDDKPIAYTEGCHANQRREIPSICNYGDPNSNYTLVLVGDSHAMQWLSPLKKHAETQGFRLLAITKSACALGEGLVVLNKGEPYESCLKWNKNLRELIVSIAPDAVLASQSIEYLNLIEPKDTSNPNSAAENAVLLKKSLVPFFEFLHGSGIKVIALKDTPKMGVDIPVCLSENLESPSKCHRKRGEVVNIPERPDPIVLAAQELEYVQLVDMTDSICGNVDCKAFDGSGIIWRDSHHITSSFSIRLYDLLTSKLELELLDKLPLNTSSKDSGYNDEVSGDVYIATKPALNGCYSRSDSASLNVCEVSTGDNGTVLAIGDSRMGQWRSALEQFGKDTGRNIYMALKNSCPLGEGKAEGLSTERRDHCKNWQEELLAYIQKTEPKTVFISQAIGYKLEGFSSYRDNSSRLAQGVSEFLLKSGISNKNVFLISDTPRLGFDAPRCIAKNGNLSPALCKAVRSNALPDFSRPNPMEIVASSSDANTVDLSDAVCGERYCPALRDDILIWRSKYLLSDLFVTRYASEIIELLKKAMLGNVIPPESNRGFE